MTYHYEPTEEDLNDHCEFLISEEKSQISKLKSLHRDQMSERHFNAVVWDYEFPKVAEVTPISNPQMDLFTQEGF